MVVLCAWLAFSANVAVAQEPADPERERAAELYRNGRTLYAEGNYEAAILSFKESLALSGESALHFNIASCLEVLGRLDEAYGELDLYRAVAPEAERETLSRRLASIRARIDAQIAEAAQAALTAPPEPAPLPPPPPPYDIGPATLALVASGIGIGAVSLTGVGLTARGIARHDAPADKGKLTVDRAFQALSWVGLGAGAGLAITGVVIVGPARVDVSSNAVTLSATF